MTHNRRDPWNPYDMRRDAVPRKAPDMAARPMIGKDETLGLETPEGFERPEAEPEVGPLEIAPLTLEGFSPQNTILAGPLSGGSLPGAGGPRARGCGLWTCSFWARSWRKPGCGNPETSRGHRL